MAVQVPACYNLNWYAPSGYSSPSAMKINHFIAANGGTLTLYTAVSAMPNFGINLSIHKITTVGSTHPHHNGIFAELVFANGNKTMLAGDCLLSAVSAAATAAPYHYMQASHHGGVYYRTTVARNPADIPACLPPPAGRQAGISCLLAASGRFCTCLLFLLIPQQASSSSVLCSGLHRAGMG